MIQLIFLIPSTLCFPLNLTEVLSSSDNVEKKQRLITTKIYDQTSTNKTMDKEILIHLMDMIIMLMQKI